MAALWLPVTAHCELEALDVHAAEQTESDDCCTPQTGCHQDNCETVEGETLLPASPSLKPPVAEALADTLGFEFRANLPAAIDPPLIPRS